MSSQNTTNTNKFTDARQAMNTMYRWTRHLYDASRKYYLLGRDHLIENIQPEPDDYVCEIGCGTARNLIKLAKTYPEVQFFGIDASDEMLKTAQTSIKKNALENSIILHQSLAQNFEPNSLFQISEPLNKMVFSYALSIIPDWKEAFDHAINLLPAGAEIHIVDFGPCNNIHPLFRKALYLWLKLFHVYYKPEIENHLKELEASGKGALSIEYLYGGYAYYAVFTKE